MWKIFAATAAIVFALVNLTLGLAQEALGQSKIGT